jgi:protocatechuate 3,4-dioxygenase, beta subunit
MKYIHLINSLMFSLFMLAHGCQAQSAKSAGVNTGSSESVIGGACDGCDIMWIGMPATVRSTDTTSGWKTAGQKLVVSGRVYMKDGRTPAAGVLLYYWQTDNNGYYSPAPGLPEKAARHGHLRGWVKTDNQGNYAIYTIRPVPYPNEDIPAHIHMLVKEPSVGNEYYIDDILFEDDKLLNTARRAELESRGGNGIVKVNKEGPVHKASRNIVLGLNIPGYPGNGN